MSMNMNSHHDPSADAVTSHLGLSACAGSLSQPQLTTVPQLMPCG
jgi:hypothetical protein